MHLRVSVVPCQWSDMSKYSILFWIHMHSVFVDMCSLIRQIGMSSISNSYKLEEMWSTSFHTAEVKKCQCSDCISTLIHSIFHCGCSSYVDGVVSASSVSVLWIYFTQWYDAVLLWFQKKVWLYLYSLEWYPSEWTHMEGGSPTNAVQGWSCRCIVLSRMADCIFLFSY